MASAQAGHSQMKLRPNAISQFLTILAVGCTSLSLVAQGNQGQNNPTATVSTGQASSDKSATSQSSTPAPGKAPPASPAPPPKPVPTLPAKNYPIDFTKPAGVALLQDRKDNALDKLHEIESTVFVKQIPALADACSPRALALANSVEPILNEYIQFEHEYSAALSEQYKQSIGDLSANQVHAADLASLRRDRDTVVDEIHRFRDEISSTERPPNAGGNSGGGSGVYSSNASNSGTKTDEIRAALKNAEDHYERLTALLDEQERATSLAAIGTLESRERELIRAINDQSNAQISAETLFYSQHRLAATARCSTRQGPPNDKR